MSEFYNRYYPTVCIRRAEMRAMAKLPLSEKSLMMPVVLLAPWLNSIKFENTHKIVSESIGNIPIIVDIDRYFQSSSDLESRTYFKELLSGDSGAIKWMDLVESNGNYIPTIQFKNVSDDGVINQIDRAKNIGRGFCFRIDPLNENEFLRIKEFISINSKDDIIIVRDFGYRDDYLSIASELSSQIRSLTSLSEDIKIVITGANFPNDFSEFDDFSTPKYISTRGVYSELSKLFGNYQIFYGDWASTKPRRYDGGGSRPLPRIDFPTKTNWIIARSKEEEWSFHEAALRVTRLPDWESRPMVWGTGMIEKTAKGLPGGISTGPEAIAARVNIHLYVQNHFADATPPPPPEGQWVDPI